MNDHNFYVFNCLASEDFIPGQFNTTFLASATEVTVNISLQIDHIDEDTEYFILYLYIPSATYRLGVRQGDIIKAVAIIFRPGKNLQWLTVANLRVILYVKLTNAILCIKLKSILPGKKHFVIES